MDDRRAPPTDVWVDKRLVVRDSPIEGQGLFFTDALAAGTTVIRLGGRLVSSAELDALMRRAAADPDAPYVDTMAAYADAHLLLPPNTLAHCSNHSCDPTLWLIDAFRIATRRDVTAGDEATIDYGTVSDAAGFSMVCHCGVAACRGEVTSNDWSRAELQQRYRGHWAPALQARIDHARPR